MRTPGQAAYEAYSEKRAAQLGAKGWPAWEYLDQDVQSCWEAAARAGLDGKP